MAIIIPSKNIYDIENPKIRDNVIDNVSVEQTVVKPNNEYETPIYNEDISNLSLKSQETINEDLQETWQINTGAYLFTGACAYAGYNSQKYHEQKVYIPKLKDNSFINKLLLGVDDNDNQNIKTTFVGTKNKGTTSGTWYGNFITSGKNELIVTKGEINYSQPTETKTDERYDIPKEISYTYQSENRGNPTATANLIDIGNLSTVSFDEETKDGIEYYTLQLKILCGIRIVYMGGYDDGMQGTISNCPFVMSGSYEEYIPTNIEITIYGNTIGIDLTNGSVTYGSGNKPFSLSGNELLQDSAYKKTNAILNITNIVETSSNFNYYKVYFDNVNINGELNYDLPIYIQGDNVNSYRLSSDTLGHFISATKGIFPTFAVGDTINVFQKNPLTKIIAENVLRQYANGKETATLLCSISDYYDENSNKVIDTKTNKMTFGLHDKEVPMIYGADRQDHAMSKVDGLAKVFEVVGTNIIYNGAVWQELFSQELGETIEEPSVPDIPDIPEETQLPAPTIAISGDTLQITDNSGGLATSFDILVNGEVKYTYAKYLYNGVLLPSIPNLKDYPYCWIRNNTRTGYYDLLLSNDAWYLKDKNTLAKSTTYTMWYQIAIASADTASEWVFNQRYSSLTWGNESDRRIMWSNYDIPNGSATATDIYFEGTEAIPSDVVLTSATLDLTTLGLASGTHSITCKAKASGYIDSPPSNAVSYVVGNEQPETPTQGLAYELSADGTYYTCKGIGTATDTDIIIASQIDGIPVTHISIGAFYQNTSITSVVIPSSITFIGDSAFYGCSSLTTIYCEAEIKPDGWDNEWNFGCDAQVIWGYKGEETYTIPAGVYVFKETISYFDDNMDLNFIANRKSYSGFGTYGGESILMFAATNSSEMEHAYDYGTNTWYDDNYRYVLLETSQTVSVESGTWFKDNTLYINPNWFVHRYITFNDKLNTRTFQDVEVTFDTLSETSNQAGNIIQHWSKGCSEIYVRYSNAVFGVEYRFDNYYTNTGIDNTNYNGEVYSDRSEGWLKTNWQSIKIFDDFASLLSKNSGANHLTRVAQLSVWLYENVKRITFTISGTTYQAIDGMTWAEWVDSSYNTLGLVNAGNEINNDSSTNYKNLKYTDTTIVNPSDTIIVNYAYILSGGSND